MLNIKTLLDEVINFLKSSNALTENDIIPGETGVNDIKDIGIKPPTIIVYVQPDTADQQNYDGYSPYTNALVTIFTCCDGISSQDAALNSTMLAFLVEKTIWDEEAFKNYLDGLDSDLQEGDIPKQANDYPNKINYGEKVTYDDYYTDFASSYFSLKISIAK